MQPIHNANVSVRTVPAVEAVEQEVQPAGQLSIVVSEHEVRSVVLVKYLGVKPRGTLPVLSVDRCQFAQGVEDLLGDRRHLAGHTQTLLPSVDMIYEVNY